MATNYDAILEEEKKKLEEPKQKQIDAVNKTHDSQASTVKTQYDKAVNDTKIGYESNYERNAVQKLINEKTIAEKNANLGLTDSGLNRTQQTAVQLSYANQKGDIDLAKQNALDTLSTNLATTLSNIEQSRIGNIAEIEASYDAQAQSNAVSRYNSTISSGSRGYSGGGKSAENSDRIIYRFAGFDEDKNKNIFYGSDGKTYYFDVGINPYVSINNSNSKYETFSNGYQPRGVYQNGKDYGSLVKFDEIPADRSSTGVQQNVWYAEDTNTYWFWRGDLNRYIQVYDAGKDEDGNIIWRTV